MDLHRVTAVSSQTGLTSFSDKKVSSGMPKGAGSCVVNGEIDTKSSAS